MAKVISSLPGSTGTLSRTSQLINDGESGVSTYVELDDISTVATTGDYNNLINVPINFTPKVHTHNISDISGTKSEFNTSLTDGDFLFAGDVISYTNEEAQDAVGSILTDTATIDFTYDDTTPTISANVKLNSIDATHLANNINVSKFTNDSGYITLADVDGTDLTYSSSLTDGTIISSTGSDAIIPLASIVNAGLISPQEKQNIASAIQLEDLANVATSGNYEDLNNIPTTFNPTPHTHPISDIVNLQTNLDLKQDNLVSGTSIKTLEGQSLLGSGNINLTKLDVGLANVPNTDFTSAVAANTAKTTNQTHTGDATGATVLTLATVNSNIGSFGTASNVPQYTVNAKGLTTASANIPIQIAESQVINLVADLSNKQATLVSGTNIRTINGNTLLGATDLTIPVATDATTLAKGIVQLAGDLGGTADNPTTPTAIHKIGDEIKHGILTLSDGLKIVGNTTSTTATKVNVQENDGTINTISKSDLVNVVEVNDVPSLPLVGEVGKIYVVKNVNKIYRWNGTFYQELAGSDISGLQAQIDLKANNSDVVKLTGNQSITGTKTFNNSTSGTSVVANNTSTGTGLSAVNSSTGTGIYSNNQSTGKGIHSDNNSTGISIYSLNYQSGNGIVSNQGVSGTGFNYVGQNNGTNTFTVNKLGATTATSFINSTAPANNILLAGGGDLAQNTAFNKNFGTTAGTVVEGGTLGSNAYSSTAYLPLSGGDLSGPLKITRVGYQLSLTGSDQGAIDLYKSGTLGHRLYSDFSGFGIYDLAANGTIFSISNSTGAANFSSSVTATSFNGSATLTGTPTAPTATVGTNTTQIATTAFVQANSSARPYKVYTALLSQSGTSAPVATVLENTLGGSITWSRNSVGVYLGTLANGFSSTLSKVRIFISGGEPSQNTTGFYNALPNNIDSVQVNTRNTSGSLADSLMSTGATIEIRVYN